LSGIAAKSGLVPSALADGGAVSAGNPFASAAGVASESSPIKSEIVEQPLVHRAMAITAAKRTKVLVMLSYLSLVGISWYPVYRRCPRVPSRTLCKIDEILWQMVVTAKHA
jgi:hypothetical protein